MLFLCDVLAIVDERGGASIFNDQGVVCVHIAVDGNCEISFKQNLGLGFRTGLCVTCQISVDPLQASSSTDDLVDWQAPVSDESLRRKPMQKL